MSRVRPVPATEPDIRIAGPSSSQRWQSYLPFTLVVIYPYFAVAPYFDLDRSAVARGQHVFGDTGIVARCVGVGLLANGADHNRGIHRLDSRLVEAALPAVVSGLEDVAGQGISAKVSKHGLPGGLLRIAGKDY